MLSPNAPTAKPSNSLIFTYPLERPTWYLRAFHIDLKVFAAHEQHETMAPDLASQLLNDLDAKFTVLETEEDVDLQARYWYELQR